MEGLNITRVSKFTIAEKDRLREPGYCGTFFKGDIQENGGLVYAVFEESVQHWRDGGVFFEYRRVL